MSEQKTSLIYQKIPAMLKSVGAIKKEKDNKAQGFKFRGVDDVYNAIHPVLAANEVFITTKVISEEYSVATTKSGGTLNLCRLKCRFRFFTTDGSYEESEIIGEAMDSGDKATNKALSVAFKYALFQLLCIPTEETAIDPDADTHNATAFDEKAAAEAEALAIEAVGKAHLQRLDILLEAARERLADGIFQQRHMKNILTAAVERFKVLLSGACHDLGSKQAVTETQESFYAVAGKHLDNKQLRELDVHVREIQKGKAA